MVCDKCKKEIQEKAKQYLYFTGTNEGAYEFMKLDKEGKTDSNAIAGTERVFKYCFKDFL